jgi:uncharacterized membrane protein
MMIVSRTILAIMMMLAGTLHFAWPQVYMKIMPPYLPWHLALIYISGAAEIFCGAGLVVPITRHFAAWSLIALLIAVMPANIYMATAHVPAPGMMGESWAQWLRLPLQIPLIYWAWLYTKG